MNTTVTIPWWLFALLLAATVLAVLEWLLLPSVRWYFRRQVRGVIDEISVRLNIDIPQFKLTRRQALIDRLLLDPKVLAAADAYATAQHLPGDVAMQQVNRYAREIVPAFNAYIYFRVGYWLSKTFARMIYRVRLGYTDSTALAAINPRSTVVFVMNHRSNMDYILVSFLAAEKVALSYAVGEWARIWPIQGLIRAMGAYFVRRDSGDPLYRMVLQRYVQMATEAGVPQAMYPEGGLTTDGRLRAPKLGLLDYMLKNFDPGAERDLVFIPVGINYDRVIEDRSLLRKLDPNATRGSLWQTLRITGGQVLKQVRLGLLGRRYRHGYACVNFGQPLSMRHYVQSRKLDLRTLDDAARRAAVAALGQTLMTQIGLVIPALPVPLVASVLLREPDRALSELELKSAVQALMAHIEALGAHVYLPRSDRDYAITVGLRMLLLRRLIEEHDGLYRADPRQLPVLAYYANSIEHLAQPMPSLAAS
ncbi:1-acyl-sn-glycerol-3-phosphate acyltransferase [Rhodoferax sp.]|uniref:1-acyl-sn-glycerol-3-phosphate acyltransferase n=1 Tax=Rhodoferax sp. TaxID=50421 RepID=UPI00274DC06C|nr:1-acyl-sn-glycerol-3-phosphate acyltransferase [Rhodoferax sp.]